MINNDDNSFGAPYWEEVDMRVLTGGDAGDAAVDDLSDADLDRLYAPAKASWLRVNMVSTLDGAATGADGRSGGINNAADRRVFDCLRRLADAVLVGSGTARAERYAPVERPLVLVSRRGDVPHPLRRGVDGEVWMITCADAEPLDEARDLLGSRHVLVLGRSSVDLTRVRAELASHGFDHILSEGGPHLLRDLLAAGAVDELDLTVVPRLLGGDHPRILAGPPVDTALQLRLILEDAGTLLMRWTYR